MNESDSAFESQYLPQTRPSPPSSSRLSAQPKLPPKQNCPLSPLPHYDPTRVSTLTNYFPKENQDPSKNLGVRSNLTIHTVMFFPTLSLLAVATPSYFVTQNVTRWEKRKKRHYLDYVDMLTILTAARLKMDLDLSTALKLTMNMIFGDFMFLCLRIPLEFFL